MKLKKLLGMADQQEQPQDATEKAIQAIEAAASGEQAGQWLSVLEGCSQLYEAALSAAKVEGEDRGLVTPEYLASVARRILRQGEALDLIEVRRGQIQLLRVASYDLTGGASPDSWRYQCDLAAPSGYELRKTPSAGVIHIRQATEPATPWRGVAPWAGVSHKLASALTVSLCREGSGPIGHILGMHMQSVETGRETKKDYEKATAQLRGGVLLYWRDNNPGLPPMGGSVSQDAQPRRLGPSFGQPVVELLDRESLRLAASCGVPPGLLDSGSDAGAQREGFRRWMHLGLAKMARLIEGELSAKLEADITLDLSPIHAADVVGRARAVGSLVQAGVDLDEALERAGFDE